jgi:protoheme IX farnesyltransferase
MIKNFYRLTKPGIIYGNAITATAGFFLASKGHISWFLFAAMLIGLSLVIASGCVFNNIFDADIDAKMDRTKNRAIASGKISKRAAKIYGTILLILGGVALSFTNNLTIVVALIGWIVYVLLYTPLKRKTVHDTLIGSIAGATPPVVGYTAITNKFDTGALLLLLILIFWQMPHFYAIAIRRLDEYKAASIPVLPLKNGIKAAKIQILVYIIAFVIAAVSLFYFGYTGYIYLTLAIILGLSWLWLAAKGFKAVDDKAWAKQTFLFSLVVLTTLSITMAFGKFLP